jgi:hypothetical protein
MLDHTMVVYGSGMNSGPRGEHSPKNLPLLVAGGSAYGLKHGLAHRPRSRQTSAALECSSFRRPKDGRGDREVLDSTGEFSELA